jgi:uncharacterized protein
MSKDLWHFPRSDLAQQVLGMFEAGLSSALIFFAPRRMGKTEFLRKDILPYAEKKGWKIFYFSFLDIGERVQEEFTNSLANFAEKNGAISNKNSILSRVRKIGAEAVGVKANIEFEKSENISDMKSIFSSLAEKGKILLLMDEIQVLAIKCSNDQFIAGLRTALDINKDLIKVIFTGSSREGLRRMFSQTSAPFFHFGQNLPFPELSREFTDHLANVFKKVTKRNLDKNLLWDNFLKMDKVPQLARSLVERLALNPNITISEAKEQLLGDVFNDRAFAEIWENSSKLEQILLKEIADGTEAIFSEKQRTIFAKKLGVPNLAVPSVQSSIRVLQRKNLIGKLPDRSSYFIDDPNFKSWLQHIE